MTDPGSTVLLLGERGGGRSRLAEVSARALQEQVDEELAITVGVAIVYFPYTAHTSSTVLRRALGLMMQGNTEATPAPRTRTPG